MSNRRLLKAAEAIREVVAQSILTELRDPRVQDVTVVGVKVSPDMREAKVAVSIMGDEKQQTLSLRGLQNAAGFLQSKIAGRIETRYTPRLSFVLDKGQQNALIVGELLAKIRREQQGEAGEAEPDAVEPEAEPPSSEAEAGSETEAGSEAEAGSEDGGQGEPSSEDGDENRPGPPDDPDPNSL